MALDSTVKVKFLGDAANLAREAARASKATDQVGRSAENAHKHLSNMAKGLLAGAGIGAAFLGVEKAVKSSVNAYKTMASETVQLARVTGQTAQDASHLIFAAKETGVEFDVLSRLTGRLEKNLAGADKAQTVLTKTHHLAIEQVARLVKGHLVYVAQLKNVTDVQKHTVAGTQSLGFALRDATGHLLPMSVLLPKIADHFQAMRNGPEKTALALKLFGKEGAAILPLLNQGSAGLAKFSEEADKLGITMSGKDVAGFSAYLASQRAFHAAIQGAKISLGRELFPVFAQWTKALADNGPLLATYARELGDKIAPAAQAAAREIKVLSDGFRDSTGTGGEIRDVLSGIGSAAGFIAKHTGALKRAAEGMAAYWAATKLAAIWNARLAASSALPAVVTGLTGVAATAPAAATGIEGVGAAATLAMPEVVALGAAVLAVYETWKTVKGAIDQFQNDNKSTAVGSYRQQHFRDYGDPNPADGPVRMGAGGVVIPDIKDTTNRSDRQAEDDFLHHRNPIKAANDRRTKAASDSAAATRAAAAKTADANKAALDKELATAAAAQRAADAKAAAADALQKATDKLRDALQSRLDMAKGIRDNIVGSNSILREGVSFTAKDLLARFNVTVAKVKRFQTALSALVHKGFSQEIVQQAAQAGLGSLGAVEGLSRASLAQVGQINRAQGAIDRAAGVAGDRVAAQLGPIQVTTQVMLNDKVLATAVNRYNDRNFPRGRGRAA